MSDQIQCDWDVILVGAGPTGLTLANILGIAGIRTLVLEQLDDIIDYPRGVGMDDEALRTFQSIGLAENICRHTTPDHWMRFVWPSGRLMATIEPKTRPYGWPRRNAFNQPLVDRELLKGLSRFDCVEVQFGASLTKVEQDTTKAYATIRDARSGQEYRISSTYLVGTDGGRSLVRETMGVSFEGITSPERFVVVDIRQDPIGRPNGEFRLHSQQPYVSIALPGGIRRLEFAVRENEVKDEVDVTEAALRQKLQAIFTDQEIDRLSIIRRRVYTHNARIASTFRKGRLFIAGDAAHLMPVWQGQGFNTGIRDAANLGWKLASVVRGNAADTLLDSYTEERHAHSKQMIDVSVLIGKIFSPKGPVRRFLRDILFNIISIRTEWRNYVTTMGWKPMPRFTSGAVVCSGRIGDTAGTIFYQPDVCDRKGELKKLDDFIGNAPAIISWGVDVARYLTDEERATWSGLGGRLIAIYPEVQRDIVLESGPQSDVLFDRDGSAKAGLDSEKATVFIVRPDRIIAASCWPVNLREALAAYMKAASVSLAPSTPLHVDDGTAAPSTTDTEFTRAARA